MSIETSVVFTTDGSFSASSNRREAPHEAEIIRPGGAADLDTAQVAQTPCVMVWAFDNLFGIPEKDPVAAGFCRTPKQQQVYP